MTAEDTRGDGTPDAVERAGRVALADELYELRCDLLLADYGERAFTSERRAWMHRRIAELEPLVGETLDTLLAEDDAPTA